MIQILSLVLYIFMYYWWCSFFSAGNGQATSMVQLPGGRFQMGTNSPDGRDGEGPVREVTVKPFAIDVFPVTNKDFRYIRYSRSGKGSFWFSFLIAKRKLACSLLHIIFAIVIWDKCCLRFSGEESEVWRLCLWQSWTWNSNPLTLEPVDFPLHWI